jgi:hypothetical protein
VSDCTYDRIYLGEVPLNSYQLVFFVEEFGCHRGVGHEQAIDENVSYAAR